MKTAVIKPGLIVGLRTTIEGGVSYRRVDLEPDHKTEDGERRAKWETERTITDADEFERAQVARSACRSAVVAVCSASSFGVLLCPQDRETDLQEAMQKAELIAANHNAGASNTRVTVSILVGRIYSDDAAAARAIASDVSSMIAAMQRGIASADPEAIRKAANEARAMQQMLSTDVAVKVSQAVEEARRAARAIVARVQKAGEKAADVVGQLYTQKLEAARMAFLDLEEGAQVEAIAPSGRGIDIEPAAPCEPAKAPGRIVMMDIETGDAVELTRKAAAPAIGQPLELEL